MAEYRVLEDLGFDRQLIRITTGEMAGVELVLVCHAPPGVERLEALLNEEAMPINGGLPPYAVAEELLRSLLDERQRAQWDQSSTFWVHTDYGEIRLGRLFNLLFRPWRGEPLTLCVVPDEYLSLPEPDVWANLLLALRGDPERFFKVANWRAQGGGWRTGDVPIQKASPDAGHTNKVAGSSPITRRRPPSTDLVAPAFCPPRGSA